MKINELSIENIVVGTGAAGLQAALRLYQNGETDLAVVAENINAGTSRNTGSDKQTYYKLSLASGDLDSVRTMAEDLFAGQCVDGDQALCEAALILVSSFGSPPCVLSSFINSNMPPGWQSNTSQIALSVEKRIALIFSVFIFERFKILDMK